MPPIQKCPLCVHVEKTRRIFIYHVSINGLNNLENAPVVERDCDGKSFSLTTTSCRPNGYFDDNYTYRTLYTDHALHDKTLIFTIYSICEQMQSTQVTC